MKKVYLDFVAGNTALGRIDIELFYDITPMTSENFRGLCTGEFGEGRIYRKKLTYKGSKIFQIIENQYLLCGDIVYNSGRGGESIYGEFFRDENFKRRHACAGLLSMNNFGKNKNNSQFIITLRACPQLDDKHVVFGRVINGMNVVREISKIPTDMNNRPKIKIFVYNCGDYDEKNIHLKQDIFKETIDEIIKERSEKEKIKIMGPEEIEKYKKELELKKKKEKEEEDDDSFYADDNKEENDEFHKINILGNNLITENNKNDNDKKDDNKNDKSENESEISESDSENSNKNLNKNNVNKDVLKEYDSILLKINEAVNLNTKAVNLNNYLQVNDNLNNNLDNNYYKRNNSEWNHQQEENKNILMAKGIPENKKYLLESINKCEKRKNYLKKKKQREINSNDLFNSDTYYRAYKKRLKDIPFDKELYDEQMKNGLKIKMVQNETKKELLKSNIEAQIRNRSNYSRRRKVLEEDEVDYATKRNMEYNRKLQRSFGKESKEIKNNLERRTAL